MVKVLEWVKETTVKKVKILECGWAAKTKSPCEVRARVVLEDYALAQINDLCAPTITSGVFQAGRQHFRLERKQETEGGQHHKTSKTWS